MNRFICVILLVIAAVLGRTPDPISDDGSYFLYRPLMANREKALPRNQGNIGTCVAVGHAGAVDVANSIRFALGKIRKLPLPASADSIYGGARNEAYGRASRSYSDGAYGEAAAKLWLKQIGGVLEQKQYEGVDLTHYDTRRCKDWGATGNGGAKDGIGGPLDKEAAKTPVKGVAKVRTLEELDVAMKNGWPVTICSNIGFNSPRDKDGFCSPRGSWPHCMFVCGKRSEGRKGYLIQNSWGDYIKGDGPNSTNKYKDQPDGSFYIEPSVMQRILNANDSWAISFDGFVSEKLPSWFFEPDGVAVMAVQATEHHDYESALLANKENDRPLVVVLSESGTHVADAVRLIVEDQVLGHNCDVVFVDTKARPDLAKHYGIGKDAHVFLHHKDKNLHFGLNHRSFQEIGESL